MEYQLSQSELAEQLEVEPLMGPSYEEDPDEAFTGPAFLEEWDEPDDIVEAQQQPGATLVTRGAGSGHTQYWQLILMNLAINVQALEILGSRWV